jgi:TetR/AcrR family transcriptional regulator, transcriptional repressor for nem operon
MRVECETKPKLLQSAMRLMSESSYGAVSVDDICRHADVRKGSFYYFFPSKTDLTIAALEAQWQERRPFLDEAFSAQVQPLQRLENYVAIIRKGQIEKKDQFGKVCGCPYLTLGSELSTQEEKIRLKVQELNTRCHCYLEQALRDLKMTTSVPYPDPAAKAQEVFAFVIGLLLQAKITNNIETLGHLRPGIFSLIGLTPAPEASF